MLEDSTRRYYEDNAEDYINKTSNADLSRQYQRFLKYLPPSGHIMDLGCGSGRDIHYFLQQNYLVDALDSSRKFCEFVNKKLGIEAINCKIQDWKTDKKYDGVWACASLLHLDAREFNSFLENLPMYLKPNGVLFASVKTELKQASPMTVDFMRIIQKILSERQSKFQGCLFKNYGSQRIPWKGITLDG